MSATIRLLERWKTALRITSDNAADLAGEADPCTAKKRSSWGEWGPAESGETITRNRGAVLMES